MKFRYARHTADLKRIEDFYTKLIGLQYLGGFTGHDGYDGIFLGFPDQNWHLEFTASSEIPSRLFDEDDCLVFYLNSKTELETFSGFLHKSSIQQQQPKNPYWREHAIMLKDPDGCNIILTFKDVVLTATDEVSELVAAVKIKTWNELLLHIRSLPYGRNQNRNDFSLVLTEGKGTCSSKHALVKQLADKNGIEGVKLVMGMYKMNLQNTPKIGNVLSYNGLEYIPEAHCYLKIFNRRIDLTSATSDIETLVEDMLEEVEIEPEQVSEFKVNYHQDFVRRWIAGNRIKRSLMRYGLFASNAFKTYHCNLI